MLRMYIVFIHKVGRDLVDQFNLYAALHIQHNIYWYPGTKPPIGTHSAD